MKLFHFYLETVSIVSYICTANTPQKYIKKQSKQTTMIIKSGTVRNWLKYLDRGDITKIAAENDTDRLRISIAINKYKGTLETIKMIDAFVENKKKALAKIETKA